MTVIAHVLVAYLYSHVLEYYAHRFLHRFKKKHQSLAFHMREHHVLAKKNKMAIHGFSFREAALLGLLAAMHFPLIAISPEAFATLVLCICSYLYVHYRSHANPQWAERHVPWHVDHHLGDQQANWGVRKPWVDILLGTRKPRCKT